MHKKLTFAAVFIPLSLLLSFLVYNLPPVHSRLAWRVDEARASIRYAINPPQEAVFIPQQQVVTPSPTEFVLLLQPTETPVPTLTPTVPGPTPTEEPTPTPTATPTPLPQAVKLDGVKYEDQHGRWNYCGPANLSMALTFWGWTGNRDTVGQYVKPNDKDKNVMPYEMQNFVETQTTGLRLLVRSGGNLDLVRSLVASGFPVLAEKGYYTYDANGKYSWLGHYQFVTGYDEERQVLIVQDSYIKDGKNHAFPYEDFTTGWRAFNFLFMVVYPSEREAEVIQLLGPWADPAWAERQALEIAEQEIQSMDGVDQYFAWFNKGTSHVNLFEYADAAIAYDEAFRLYDQLPNPDMRPYRMLWYQTGPYKAYYYTWRYQDTINLADFTLTKTISEPVLEESLYWRALAKEAAGDINGAVADLRKAIELNHNFFAGISQLNRILGQ
jgi:tetratricopeptide (TPR) repeat protein